MKDAVLTVAQLIERLSRFEGDAPVWAHVTQGDGVIKPVRSVESDPHLTGNAVYLVAYDDVTF